MSKLAVILAVVAMAAGGYALFELKQDAGEPPATAASVDALQKRVAALADALATETKAREAAEARLATAEGEATKLVERITTLENRKSDARGPLTATGLTIQTSDGKTLLRLGKSPRGGGVVEVYAKNGKQVAKLFARSDNDGELVLYDENGVLSANMGGNDTGGYANFWGAKNRLAAYIGADSAKPSGYIAVYGPGKQEIVGLYGNKKGGVVSVRNAATKKPAVYLAADADRGTGFVGLGDANGDARLALWVTDAGGQIKALNRDKQTAAFLGVSSNPAGNGLLYVCRKDGNRIAEVGANASGGGYMSIRNGLNERVLFLGASTGTAPDDGVLEVSRKGDKLGVVLRGYSGGSSVRVYDNNEKVKANLR